MRSDGTLMQFDVGRGTLQRLAAIDVTAVDIDAIFVSRLHSDHLAGLPDLVLTRWTPDRDNDFASLPIVAPSGPAISFLERMLDPWHHDLVVGSSHNDRTPEPRCEAVPFDVGDTLVEVWGKGGVRVLAGRVRHEPVRPAVGFRIEMSDGSNAITGDTLVCDEMAELAAGVDVLVYEDVRFEIVQPREPHVRYVLAYDADTQLNRAQAAELEVTTLVLTHLIPAPEIEEAVQQFVDDIRGGGFEGELVMANDLDEAMVG